MGQIQTCRARVNFMNLDMKLDLKMNIPTKDWDKINKNLMLRPKQI